MSSPATNLGKAPQAPANQPPTDILPTLFGAGYGTYAVKPATFVLSFLAHTVGVALLLASSLFVVTHQQEIKKTVVSLVTDISPYVLPASSTKSGGGGGGGDRDLLAASKGSPPMFAKEQFTPPMVVIRNEEPKLVMAPTVVGPENVNLQTLPVMGDPMAKVTGPPSNGTGSGGGIGDGSGGGVGSGRGPGVGPGWGGGIGGGVYRVGGGVSAPRQLYSPDPEYSEEARKAKYQGTVILTITVGPDGRVHDPRVTRSLGLGLDEQALKAVQSWTFEPAKKDGVPVAVLVSVEVNFRLY